MGAKTGNIVQRRSLERRDDPAFDAGQAEVVDSDVDPFRVMSVKASDEIDRAAEIPAVRGGADDVFHEKPPGKMSLRC